MNKTTKRTTISFSQLSMYNQCEYKWYLSYAENLRSYKGNINFIFGTAMHEVLQLYLEIMYTHGVKKANLLDLNKILFDKMFNEFKKYYDKDEINEKKSKLSESELSNFVEPELPCSPEEIIEFYNDGVLILEFFKKHRLDYFTNDTVELVGIEVPLNIEMENNTEWVSFLDLVTRNKINGKIKIYDFKTSSHGWKDYKKKDDNTISQLILYKHFYSQFHNIDIKDIDVEFLILKRKLYENVDFPQKRIQRFEPTSGSITIKKHKSNLNNFIKTCFTDTGEYNRHRIYHKNPTKLCEYCEFYKKHCDGESKL